MTDQQKKFLMENPQFERIGPPRPVQFSEWGTLHPDGSYERQDNAPRMASIAVGTGGFGIAVLECAQ